MAERSRSMKPVSQSSSTAFKPHGYYKDLANTGMQVTMTGMWSLPKQIHTQTGGVAPARRDLTTAKQAMTRHSAVAGLSVIKSTSVGGSGVKSRAGMRGTGVQDIVGKRRREVEQGREQERIAKGPDIPGREKTREIANTVAVRKRDIGREESMEKTKPEAKLPYAPSLVESAGNTKLDEKKPLQPLYPNSLLTPTQVESKLRELKAKSNLEATNKPTESVPISPPIPTREPVRLPDPSPSNPLIQPFLTPKKDSPDSLASQSTTETITRPPSSRKHQDFSTNALTTLMVARPEEVRIVGLRNFGNVCFMNAVLQCLFFTPRIEEALQGSVNEVSKTEGDLVRAVRELLADMRLGQHTSLSVTKVKGIISTVAPQFSDFAQHDAQEFLRFLLDALHEELNKGSKAQKAQKITRTLEGTQKIEDLANLWWQESIRRDSSGLTDLFQGQLMHILTCSNCHNSTYTFEVFLDLSLPIPVAEGSRYSAVGCSLQQCFEEFTSEKEIEGVKCKRCGPQVCKGKMMVHRFPKVLVLHLKRFTMEIDFEGKINAPVTCPASNLDLGKYASRTTSTRYDLYAIAHHIGDIDYGHYYA